MADESFRGWLGRIWIIVILIVLGFLGWLGQLLDVQFSHFVRPLFIFAPGALLAFVAPRRDYTGEKPFLMLGSLIAMTGLLLYYQSLTGHRATWVYTWTLIAPTAVGLGQWFYGKIYALPGTVKTGKNLVRIGLIMFGVGFAFFELLLNISGFNLGFAGWGIFLILLGIMTTIRPFSQK